MIVKEKVGVSPNDRFGRAGFEAEKQMAFYLRRAFGESPDVYVFNDLRFERNAEIVQIDHLVLYRFGFVLIESKSVTGTIEVNRQLEFVRTFGRQRKGMKSPITQVEMQKQLLQLKLNDHKESLRRKVMGMIQASFADPRFTTFVAISDQGEIKRRGCDPPQLVKADQVAFEIKKIIDRNSKASGFGGIMRQILADKKTAKKLEEEEVILAFTEEETAAIGQFLLREHVEVANAVEPPPVISPAPQDLVEVELVPEPRPPAMQATHTCRHCKSQDVEIAYGKYGYYFKCRSCAKNTPIEFSCGSCDGKARISKKGKVFQRQCDSCGTVSHFFTNPE